MGSKVTLKKVHTAFSVTDKSGHVCVQIPDMLAGERRDLLVELSVPESQAKTNILEASVKYWDLAARKTVQTAVVPMEVERLADDEPDQEPDAEVTTQRNRVEVAQTLETAEVHKHDDVIKMLSG